MAAVPECTNVFQRIPMDSYLGEKSKYGKCLYFVYFRNGCLVLRRRTFLKHEPESNRNKWDNRILVFSPLLQCLSHSTKQQTIAFLMKTSAFVPSVDMREHVLFHLLRCLSHSIKQQPIEFLMESSAIETRQQGHVRQVLATKFTSLSQGA